MRRQKKTQVKPQIGGAWWNTVWNMVKSAAPVVNDLAKSTKIVSKGLDSLGYKGASDIAGSLGYGKKKRKTKAKGAGRKPRVKLF
jgi:hypothetical protein